ncbi:MAG: PP2C family protein-serine/threonine phosphatase [Thermoanaerobaculia bacterium]
MPAQASPEVIAMLREDLLPTAVGLVICGLGLAAGALLTVRRRPGRAGLLSFAGFAALYGLRLLLDTDAARLLLGVPGDSIDRAVNVLTYLIPISGFFFFETLIGRGWRSSLWRIWQLFTALAVVAVPLEFAAPSPGLLLAPYRVLVLASMAVMLLHLFWPGWMRRPDRWPLRACFLVLALFVTFENLGNLGTLPDVNLEPIGFLFFLGGLGVIAARRAVEDQESLSSIRQELDTARRIQEATLPQGTPRIAGLDVAARYVPAASVAGDFYDFLPLEGRRLGVFVADVSGHGVPAALVAAMLKVAVAAGEEHAASPARLLSGINQIFHGKLRGQFITACYVFLDLDAGRLTYASAGHPPPLLWRGATGAIEELAHGGLVMGRLKRAVYTEEVVPFGPGDRLLLFTDGIPEAANARGEQLGEERLRGALAAHAAGPAEGIAEAVLAGVRAWTGRGEAFEDDLTLVAVGA